MITTAEENKLIHLLDLAPTPDDTLTYPELLGYLFGLAITPEKIPPDEWVAVIFGGDPPALRRRKKDREAHDCLLKVAGQFADSFQTNQLDFPFDLERLEEEDVYALFDWVSGFEEALALRDELWDPEMNANLSETQRVQLYHSLLTVEGLVDPGEALDFFDNVPEEIFQELFPDMDNKSDDEWMAQVQLRLLATLPLAVMTLQEYSRRVQGLMVQHKPALILKGPGNGAKKSADTCDDTCGSGCSGGCGSSSKAAAAEKQAGNGNVIRVDFKNKKRLATEPAPIYRFKITLDGVKPPIWRRIEVPGDCSLGELHQVIQLAMGWQNLHLHHFFIDHTAYGPAYDDDGFGIDRPNNEDRFTIHQMESKLAPGFIYIYDLGDSWIHRLTVEKQIPPKKNGAAPKVISGRRACPPEDCGGIPGMENLLDLFEDGRKREVAQIAGKGWDPARFGKEEITKINNELKLFRP